MRRSFMLVPLVLVAACTGEANHLGNPFLLPARAVEAAVGNGIYNERRGRVEVFVKTNHPALISDIRAGGGPALTEAMDLAQIPEGARGAATLQYQSDLALYSGNPGALVSALMVYGA